MSCIIVITSWINKEYYVITNVTVLMDCDNIICRYISNRKCVCHFTCCMIKVLIVIVNSPLIGTYTVRYYTIKPGLRHYKDTKQHFFLIYASQNFKGKTVE